MVQTPEWVANFEKCKSNWHTEDPDSTQPICYLATVDSEGRARVRVVGVASLSYQSQYSFWTVLVGTDARSPKCDQIRANPEVEIAVWFPSEREQYRISGKAFIVDKDTSDAVWLNERRKIFDSLKEIRKEHYRRADAPGTPLGRRSSLPDEEDPNSIMKAEMAALNHYALIVLRVESCDWTAQIQDLRKRYNFLPEADEDEEEQWEVEDLRI